MQLVTTLTPHGGSAPAIFNMVLRTRAELQPREAKRRDGLRLDGKIHGSSGEQNVFGKVLSLGRLTCKWGTPQISRQCSLLYQHRWQWVLPVFRSSTPCGYDVGTSEVARGQYEDHLGAHHLRSTGRKKETKTNTIISPLRLAHRSSPWRNPSRFLKASSIQKQDRPTNPNAFYEKSVKDS